MKKPLFSQRTTPPRHREASLLGQALHDASPCLPRGARHQHRLGLRRARGSRSFHGEEGGQQGTAGQLLEGTPSRLEMMKISICMMKIDLIGFLKDFTGIDI